MVIENRSTHLSPFARAKAVQLNVGEGLQTLAQNDRRGLKTPTYEVTRLSVRSYEAGWIGS